jgi:hypothetical protein
MRDYEQPTDARESGNDLLYHAIREIFLLRVAAHICEGQDGNRRLVGKGSEEPIIGVAVGEVLPLIRYALIG